MQLKYGKEQFNYLMSVMNYFIGKCEEDEIRKRIWSLREKMEGCHSWLLEDRMYIVLTLDDGDISTLLYVFENILFYTVEGQSMMHSATDVFSYLRDMDENGV